MKKAKMGTDKAFVKEVIQVIYQIAFVRYRVPYYSTSFSECWVFYFECCWAVLTYIDTDKAFVKEVIQAIIRHGVQYHFAFPTLIFVVLF